MSTNRVKNIVKTINLAEKGPRVHAVFAAETPTTTPTFTQLNAISEGKTDFTRVGRTIYPTQQRLQLVVVPAGRAILRTLLVKAKHSQQTAQQLVIGDIKNIAGTQLAVYDTPQLINGKYKIIWDKLTTLDNAEDQKVMLDKHNFKRGMMLKFSGTASTTCLSSIFVYMVTDGTMNQPVANLTSQLWFRDDEVNTA